MSQGKVCPEKRLRLWIRIWIWIWIWHSLLRAQSSLDSRECKWKGWRWRWRLRETAREKKRVKTPEKETRYTGCICADEMGLGKSFQATAVLAAFTKSKKVRALIVCPSSLISNWTREIQKWMSVAMVPLVITPGCTPSPAEKIKSFGTNAKNFVMIMSFEMFRKHVEELNQVSSLEVLVIDEAHPRCSISHKRFSWASPTHPPARDTTLHSSPPPNSSSAVGVYFKLRTVLLALWLEIRGDSLHHQQLHVCSRSLSHLSAKRSKLFFLFYLHVLKINFPLISYSTSCFWAKMGVTLENNSKRLK